MIVQVPVDAIDIVSGTRKTVKADDEMLALSIKKIGLMQMITFMPSEVPNRYTLIAGRRRLTAIRALGWAMVDGNLVTVSDVDRQIMEIDENLCRTELAPIERAEAVKLRVSLYSATHPAAAEAIKLRETQRDRGDRKPRETKAKEPAADDPPPLPPMAAVAKHFGVTEQTVRKDIRRAEGFTEPEKVILKDRDTSQRQMDYLLKLEPAEKVQVINLLAISMDFQAALKEVLGDRYVDEEPVSDEDFLASLPVRTLLRFPARFDADALFYRKIQAQRISFARMIGWGGAKAKIGTVGIYERRLLLFMEAKHPRDWIKCGQCLAGQTPKGECMTCRGGGYLID